METMLSALCSNVNRKKNWRSLVLFPGSLGDLVCALPALEEIQRQQNGDLVLAVRGEAFGLGSFLPFVTEIRSLEEQVFSQLFSPPTALQNEARDFFSSFSTIVSWHGHSHVEVGENFRVLVGERFRSFPFFIGQENCHVTAYYLRCVGMETLQCPVLQLGENAIRWREHYWQQHGLDTGSRVLLLHPGSGGKKKRWEPEGFRRIACWWQQTCLGKCLILLGPTEEGEVEQWWHVGGVETSLSLWQVAALLSRTDLYLGNDSGVSHVAGAVGARGVVLFGPTNPQQWKPLGGGLSVVRNTEYRAELPAAEGISLKEISEEQVIEQLLTQGGCRDLPFHKVKPYIKPTLPG